MSVSILRAATAALLPMLAPGVAAAQGLTIEHEPARCIVAGRAATLRACFVPAAQLAVARLHFRVDTREAWSQVEMRADAGCHAAVLPAQGRALAGTTLLYSIEAVDRASAPHRTAEFAPVLVARAADCGGGGALAPVAGRGVAKSAVIGGVAAAGVAGVAIASGGSAAPSATTVATAPATTAPPATQPPTPHPPTPVPGGSLSVACQASPRSGTAPLRVDFAVFPTGATGAYVFEWSFGDGGTSSNPNPSHTYAATGRFDAVVRVTSGGETATCARDITVTAPQDPGPGPVPTPTPTPSPTPTPTPTPPPPSRTLTVTTHGSNQPGIVTSNPAGIACMTVPPPGGGTCIASFPHGTNVRLDAMSVHPLATVSFSGACSGSGTGSASCNILMDANKSVNVLNFRSSVHGGAREPAGITVSSELDAPGAEARLTVNEGSPAVVGPGLVSLAARTRIGTNSAAGTLVRGAGRPGTWRFELAGMKPGSLRVVAGAVAVITGNAVVFRLQGRRGERIVFTFDVED